MPRHVDHEALHRALILARNLGPAEASRRTGINAATIRSRLSRGGETDAVHAGREKQVRGAKLTNEQRRQLVADKLLRLADGFLDAIVIPEPKSVADLDDIKVLAVALGISLDKLQRMMGDAGADEDQVIEVDLGSVRRPKEGQAAAG